MDSRYPRGGGAMRVQTRDEQAGGAGLQSRAENGVCVCVCVCVCVNLICLSLPASFSM